MTRGWIHVGMICVAAAVAAGQPSGPAAAPAPSAAEVLARLQARYRTGPVCERLGIEVRSDSGRVARSWAIVRIAPAADAATGPRLMLELGPLRIAADAASLVAVHERNPETCFVASIPGDGPLTSARLRGVLPPVPVFQLDLLTALGPDRFDEFTPYARNVHWTVAAADARQPGRFSLTGAADVGHVSMQVRNDQVQSVDIRDEHRGVTLRIQVSPVAPCRENDLSIDTTSRTRVHRLADLQPRSGILRVGSTVPELQLSTAAGQVQRLRDLFAPPAAYLPAPDADRLVLVFTRRDKPDWSQPRRFGRVDAEDLGRQLLLLQREVFAPRPSQPGEGEAPALLATFNHAQVMVLESPPGAEELLGLIKSERRRWGGGDDGAAGEHLAWSTDPRTSVDLFAAAGESAAIIIDQSLRLRSVVVIGEHTTTEQLVDQIAAALMDTGAEPR